MAIEWKKIGKNVNQEGTTITYGGKGTDMVIQSRKRRVPHSSRSGYWAHTTYVLLKRGVQICEKLSLKDAKEVAESLEENDE